MSMQQRHTLLIMSHAATAAAATATAATATATAANTVLLSLTSNTHVPTPALL